jgi:hypothetical protein
MRIFGKEQRRLALAKKEEIKINELFGLDDFSMAIDEFQDPFITCCFVNDD